MDDTASTDPLRPIDLVSKFLGTLLLASLVALAVLTALGVLGVGPRSVGLGTDVCTDVASGAVPFGLGNADPAVDSGAGDDGFVVHGRAPGASFYPSSLSICLDHPGVWSSVAYQLTSWPTILVLGGFLLLVRRLVSRARAQGLFTPGVARLAAVLGWYVLVGSLVVTLVEALATAVIVDGAVPGRFSLDTVELAWDMPWTALLAGVGVLTIARVMQRATAMRQDLDATI